MTDTKYLEIANTELKQSVKTKLDGIYKSIFEESYTTHPMILDSFLSNLEQTKINMMLIQLKKDIQDKYIDAYIKMGYDYVKAEHLWQYTNSRIEAPKLKPLSPGEVGDLSEKIKSNSKQVSNVEEPISSKDIIIAGGVIIGTVFVAVTNLPTIFGVGILTAAGVVAVEQFVKDERVPFLGSIKEKYVKGRTGGAMPKPRVDTNKLESLINLQRDTTYEVLSQWLDGVFSNAEKAVG
jgi:hypothetical protein